MWKDAAQGAVIQEGGQGAVCRNDAPGAVIWAHSYTVEPTQREPQLLGAGVRHSAHGKGHEEGGLTYAKAGWSLRSPPGNPRASTPKPEPAYFTTLCSHLHL